MNQSAESGSGVKKSLSVKDYWDNKLWLSPAQRELE
jgi:hypothetical protein